MLCKTAARGGCIPGAQAALSCSSRLHGGRQSAPPTAPRRNRVWPNVLPPVSARQELFRTTLIFVFAPPGTPSFLFARCSHRAFFQIRRDGARSSALFSSDIGTTRSNFTVLGLLQGPYPCTPYTFFVFKRLTLALDDNLPVSSDKNILMSFE